MNSSLDRWNNHIPDRQTMEENMQADLMDIRSRIGLAVEDYLRAVQGSIDIRKAAEEILNYVFQGVDPAAATRDTERYSWYYELLGRSIAIAQGWKENYADEVKASTETIKNIRKYIKNTYGHDFSVSSGKWQKTKLG